MFGAAATGLPPTASILVKNFAVESRSFLVFSFLLVLFCVFAFFCVLIVAFQKGGRGPNRPPAAGQQQRTGVCSAGRSFAAKPNRLPEISIPTKTICVLSSFCGKVGARFSSLREKGAGLVAQGGCSSSVLVMHTGILWRSQIGSPKFHLALKEFVICDTLQQFSRRCGPFQQ